MRSCTLHDASVAMYAHLPLPFQLQCLQTSSNADLRITAHEPQKNEAFHVSVPFWIKP
ncbi:Uncharacterised protein [Escherichia coli]|uniref:Uncharacterized protein n=1 Tax=Escherichia coli TaxID=562 RepID=A0A376L8D3_ECOLX|nr:Uncharacterised protein [Escherichia coli]